MQKALVYHNGCLIKTYEFDKQSLSIGRLPTNDISINSMAISRNHLQLEYCEKVGAFVASDQQSLNGTMLNGNKVEQNTAIPSGSHLAIGQYSFTLEYTETTSTDVSSAASTPIATDKVAEQSDTISMGAVKKTAIPPLKSTSDTATEGTGTAGLYFGGNDTGKKGDAVIAPKATAILIEQSTQMEHSIQKKEITFGNAPGDDIFIGEGKLAKITVHGKSHEIKALKVMGKIVVNDVKVGQHVLNDGDVFKVGKNTFTFKLA